MINRETILAQVNASVKNKNLVRHLLAVEAAMRALAGRLGGNEDEWGNLGLLHDEDWERTEAVPAEHTRQTLKWLESQGLTSGPLVDALRSHNRRLTNLGEPQGTMAWALDCVDELTGFLVAVALVRPDRKLSSVSMESVTKKWKAKEFARAVDRSQIEQCKEKLGLELNEFIAEALNL